MDSQIELNTIRELKGLLLDIGNIHVTQEHPNMRLSPDYACDLYLIAKVANKETVIAVEAKGHVNNLHQVRNFIEFSATFNGLSLLVAEEISDPIKKTLKEKSIGFIEWGKVIFLPIQIPLTERIHNKSIISKTGFRADTAMKLLFYFLCNRDALNYSQRQLASNLGVSLGSINVWIKMFEQLKVITTFEESRRVINNWESAVEDFRLMYKHSAKEKLLIGRFSPVDQDFRFGWKFLDLTTTSSYWGGEPAAHIETGYLQPEVFTIHTYENQMVNLLKTLKLKKDPDGNIFIYRAFWPEDLNRNAKQTCPLLLIYSELLNSEIDRNIEAAQEIGYKMKATPWQK